MGAASPSWLHRRARLRRFARPALLALAALIAVLGGLSALLVHRASALVHAAAVAEAERFGARIGRAVTVGPARVDVGAELCVEIRDLRIAAAPGQSGPAADPLFELAALRVRLPAWPLIRSFGRAVEVRALEADAPVLRLVRLPDGELSYADVVAKLAAPEPSPEPPRRARLGSVRVTGARAELHDLPRGVRLAVDRIDALVPELRDDASVDLALDASLLAPAPNLRLDLRFSPRAEPPGPLGRLRRAAVRLAPLDVDPLLPFVPVRGGTALAGARLSADLGLVVDPKGTVSVAGSISAAALRLAREGAGGDLLGQPVDVALSADLTVDPEEPALDARAVSLTVAGMTVEGRADVRGPVSAPEVRALDLRARDLSFERLLPLLPPALLPRGASFAGPIALHAQAHGPPRAAEIDVSVDLREASVSLPELRKPAGVAFSAELRGKTGDGLAIDALGVRLGPLAIALRGHVRSAADVDLAFDSGDVPLDALLRLSPSIAHGVPEGVSLAGHVQAAGHVKRGLDETRVEVKVAVRRAGVKTPALTLEGDADLRAAAHLGRGAQTITVDLDAGAARARIPDKLDKPAGAPLSVHARIERAGAVTHARDVRLHLAGAAVAGELRHDAAASALVVDATRCELDLGALGRALPALAAVPPALAGAAFRGKVRWEGDPKAPGAAHLQLAEADLRAPLAHLTGSVDVRGLSPLGAVTFDLASPSLDLARLGGGATRTGGSLDAVSAHGKLHLGRLIAGKLMASDVDAELALEKGALSFPALRLAAFGGRLSAGGSRVSFAGAAPSFSVRARAERIDLESLAASSDVRGKLDAELSLDGAGADWAAVAPTLAGTVKLSLDHAHVHGKHALRGTVVNPLIGKLAERARKKHPVREVDTDIERASTVLTLGGGKVTLSTPLVAHTGDGELTVEGSVGFDRTLALRAALVIPPAVIEKASKGWLVPSENATVKVKVDGTSDAPRIELLDLAGTARSLRGAFLSGLGKKIEHAVGND